MATARTSTSDTEKLPCYNSRSYREVVIDRVHILVDNSIKEKGKGEGVFSSVYIP